MNLPLKKRISFKLALVGLGFAFALGLILSLIHIALDYSDQSGDLDARVEGIVKSARSALLAAGAQPDAGSRRRVVDGLLEHDFIHEVRVTDILGNELKSQSVLPEGGAGRWITGIITTEFEKHSVTLGADGDDATGSARLTVVVDRHLGLSGFYRRSLITGLSIVFGTVALAGLLITVFNNIVSAPLLGLAMAIDSLDPNELGKTRMPQLTGHHEDEIGLISRTTNRFIQGSEEQLAERERAEEALKEREMRLQGIAENIPGIVFQRVRQADGGFSFSYLSAGLQRMHGLEPEHVIANHSDLLDVVHPDDRQRHVKALNDSAEKLAPINMELRHLKPDGSIVWIHSMARPYRLAGGSVIWDGVDLDITERKRAEERLQYLAHYDILTGLPNREAFLELLRRSIAMSQRADTQFVESEESESGRMVAVSRRTGRKFTLSRRLGQMFGVLFLDLDDFKSVNDTLGHSIGDLLLKAVAERLQGHMRKSDALARHGSAIVSRLGGDEFTIILNNLTDVDGAATAAERIIEVISEPYSIEGNEIHTGSSIGISIYPEDGDTPEQLLKNADLAMYRSKADKRTKFHFYVPEMNAEVSARKAMEGDLREALGREEMWLCYQPQVDLKNGEIAGMEALLRWTHPERGEVPPAKIIPVAEATNLIIPIGEWVLQQACMQNKAWQDQGLPLAAVTVNVSAVQIEYQDVLAMVEKTLSDTGLEPRYLHIEVTESTVMSHMETALATLHNLREIGVKVYLDDFGTGYSSLSYLKRFPIDNLKIDRAFVRGVTANPDDAAIAVAIINMAHTLNMKVTAEGVETEEQLDFLMTEGCDTVQGFYFSRPVPPDEFSKLLSIGKFSLERASLAAVDDS